MHRFELIEVEFHVYILSSRMALLEPGMRRNDETQGGSAYASFERSRLLTKSAAKVAPISAQAMSFCASQRSPCSPL